MELGSSLGSCDPKFCALAMPGTGQEGRTGQRAGRGRAGGPHTSRPQTLDAEA